MNKDTLYVFWGKDRARTIRQFEDPSQLTFRYENSWRESGGQALSFSLPLSDLEQPRWPSIFFFGNYLPEGLAYLTLTLFNRIPQGDTFHFLSRFGRECAGALTILPYGGSVADSPVDYRDISSELAEQLMLAPEKRSNLIAATGSRLSLTGEQNKLPVVPKNGQFLVPAELSFASTTHIIKAPSGGFKDIQYNEAFCMELSRASGLPTENLR
jgi:serine/threonine-protein kinase HipA